MPQKVSKVAPSPLKNTTTTTTITTTKSQYPYRVPEINSSPMAVCKAPLIEDLQEEVGHLLMRLFELIQQHHLVRTTSHGFGQDTTFFVTYITRWGSNQTGLYRQKKKKWDKGSNDNCRHKLFLLIPASARTYH